MSRIIYDLKIEFDVLKINSCKMIRPIDPKLKPTIGVPIGGLGWRDNLPDNETIMNELIDL